MDEHQDFIRSTGYKRFTLAAPEEHPDREIMERIRTGDYLKEPAREEHIVEQQPVADAKVYTAAEIDEMVKSVCLSLTDSGKRDTKTQTDIKPVSSINDSADFKSKFMHDFTVIDVLGEGSFGTVFKNQYDCCKYAVKRVAVRTNNKRQLDRALREIRVMSQLDHPNIVRYHSTWMDEPPEFWQQAYEGDCAFIYIQMQLCQKPLDQWIKDNQDQSSRDISTMKLWFKQIVSAVAYIQSKKLLHRDLKPSNILIAEDGRLKVCDLGIASEQRLENGTEVVVTRTYKSWTELYRSPEQNSQLPRYSSILVFTLGLILVELCCLMTSEERTRVFNCYRSGAKTDLNVDPITAEFIAWITQVDPADRPSCSEMLNNEFLRTIHSPMCCH